MSGPCIYCGAVNYAPSMGGPMICPSCDCGNFGPSVVQRQGETITDLRTQLASEQATSEAACKAQRASASKLNAAVSDSESLRAQLATARKALEKIADLVDSEADEPLDDAIRIALAALNSGEQK